MSRASTRNLPGYLSSLENVPDGSDTAMSVQVPGRSDCVVSIALDPPVGIPTLIPRYAHMHLEQTGEFSKIQFLDVWQRGQKPAL